MDAHTKARERLAVICLILAALCWGVSYPLTKYVENCPTFYIISIRFAVAAVMLAIIFHKRFRNFHVDILKYSFLLSFIITAMYVLNIVGVKYTTSIKASFFTTLSFLIVPVINLIAYRIRISRIIFISAAICLLGVIMLCYAPGLGGLNINIGDFLCFLASIAGAVNIVYMEKISHRKTTDPILFVVFLMAFVSLWGTVISLVRGEFANAEPSKMEFYVIIIMGLVSSAGAFTLQMSSEKYVPSNRVGIIFSLEPASGCILSALILKESMSLVGWAGALIIMLSILYMEFANNRSADSL